VRIGGDERGTNLETVATSPPMSSIARRNEDTFGVDDDIRTGSGVNQ
jgi:hypothetical protein